MMQLKYVLPVKLMLVLLIAFGFSACKKTEINPQNNFSYKIKSKKYEYQYITSTGDRGFFGSYYSITAETFFPGAILIKANNGTFTYNKIKIWISKKDRGDLPTRIDLSDTANYRIDISMERYKKIDGFNFEIIRDKDAGYIDFSHLGEDYVEGSFEIKMKETKGNKVIHLKNGKFRSNVNYVGS